MQIVHSHDFNRYLSPFKAVWDAKDPTENLVVIGRYISEDLGGVALHPIDFINASSGRLVKAMTDQNVTTICPVVAVHGSADRIATGSSRNIYVWEAYDAAEGALLEASGDDEEAGHTLPPSFRFTPRMLDLDDKAKKGGKGKAGKDEGDTDDDVPMKKKAKK